MHGHGLIRVISSIFCLGLLVCRPVTGQQRVAVIGAGVHGLLAAIECKQRGWNVTVYEKEPDLLPIIPSININGINYEYYSQTIYSSATYEKQAPNPALLKFASTYNQTIGPWTASAAEHTLYYDTDGGPAPYPSVWAHYFTSESGVLDLVQQLAEAVTILREVGTNASVPTDLIEVGIVASNQSIVQWEQQVGLPAYSTGTEVWWYAVCSAHHFGQS